MSFYYKTFYKLKQNKSSQQNDLQFPLINKERITEQISTQPENTIVEENGEHKKGGK